MAFVIGICMYAACLLITYPFSKISSMESRREEEELAERRKHERP
jgi:hypothetical protein